MRIELLYIDGCPGWQQTMTQLKEILREQEIRATVEPVDVTDNEEAQRLRFLGSPTVRVDGKDVEPGTPESGFNMECRLYWVDGKPTGAPPREWLSRAITEAA